MTQLQKIQIPSNVVDLFDFAERISESQLVPTEYRKKPADIVLAMMFADQLGLPPLVALGGIAVVQGKAKTYGATALAVIQGHPDFLDLVTEERTTSKARVTMTRRGREPVSIEFTLEEAKAAGLTNRDTYKKHLSDMLWWRAVHRCITALFADVAQGITYMAEGEIREREVDGTLIETRYEGPEPTDSPGTVPGALPSIDEMLGRIGNCNTMDDIQNPNLMRDLGAYKGTDRKTLGAAYKQRADDIEAAA